VQPLSLKQTQTERTCWQMYTNIKIKSDIRCS